MNLVYLIKNCLCWLSKYENLCFHDLLVISCFTVYSKIIRFQIPSFVHLIPAGQMSQHVAVLELLLLWISPSSYELITLQWENSGSGRWKFMRSNQAPCEFLNLNMLTGRYNLHWINKWTAIQKSSFFLLKKKKKLPAFPLECYNDLVWLSH